MNLKHCISGGEPLNPEVMSQWKSKTGLDIHDIYGQTETVCLWVNILLNLCLSLLLYNVLRLF